MESEDQAAASSELDEDLEEPHDERRATGGVPLRPVLVVALLLLLAFVAYGAYSCVRSAGGGSSFSDSASHFPMGSVTYLASGRTYLVRAGDGSFLALSDAEASDADRRAGCLIRYRPDLRAGDQSGVFRDDCHGVLFDRSGSAVQGSSPPMQRHPVTLAGSAVTVHFKTCTSAENQPEACRQ